ncbi:hypothetical protein PR048_016690 [Dryococelus australis]|uniref:Uncharacterized protein n=1 Tax=Dryococelus australis TaxID=614101 RepID=A0ABQ9H7F2_9NEOP|nr:hypothetical protein PR048_016690 [Dryococelus australis]
MESEEAVTLIVLLPRLRRRRRFWVHSILKTDRSKVTSILCTVTFVKIPTLVWTLILGNAYQQRKNSSSL